MQTHHIQIDGGWRAVQLLFVDATGETDQALVRDVLRGGTAFWVPYASLEKVVMRSEWEERES